MRLGLGPRARVVSLLGLALLLPLVASAQIFERPGEERPQEPPYLEPDRQPVLPAVPPAVAPDTTVPTQPAVFVREIQVEGSTVFEPAELAAIVAPFTGRILRADELVAIRRALTRHYIEQGYVSSGAVIPPQQVPGGVLRVRIVEGTLSAIEIRGNRRLRSRYLEDRIRLGSTTPLNVNALEERLQRLQLDPLIVALRAHLAPGTSPGESVLEIEVVEATPYGGFALADNGQPPSLGEVAGEIGASYRSATGWNDRLEASFVVSEGLRRLHGSYRLPVSRYDTQLGIFGEYSESELVDSLGRALEIEAESYTIDLFARQPLWRTRHLEIALEVHGAYRRSETRLLGIPFSFVPGPERGVASVSVLRFVQETTYRDLGQVAVARSMLSVGVDALGATTHTGSIPDGRYVAWLAQLLWARRLPWLDAESVVRTDLQLADDPLLPLEQIGVGGRTSVRGYRTNLFVRDQAVLSSLDLRIPLLSWPRWEATLSLAPFFDYAYSWNRERRTFGRHSLGSPGVGLRLDAGGFLEAEVYWGYAIWDVDPADRDPLQDEGVHLQLRMSL